ncbi:gcy-25, partial [Pristionchus pacificus]
VALGLISDDNSTISLLTNSRVLFILSNRESFFSWLSSTYFSFPHEYSLFFMESRFSNIRDFFQMAFDSLSKSAIPRSQRLLKYTHLVQFDHLDHRLTTKFLFDHELEISDRIESSLLLCDAITLLLLNSTLPLYFKGITGDILIDENGIRQSYFRVHRLTNGLPSLISTIYPSFTANETMHYFTSHPSSFSDLPSYKPHCNFDGSDCSITHIIIISLLISVAVISPLSLAWYLQRKERELQKMSWRISYEEIKNEQENCINLPSNHSSSMRSLSCIGTTQFDAIRGSVRGQKVSVKTFMQKKAITFTRKEMEYLNQIKGISHANLNTFEGISFNQNGEFVVCWSYTQRQSLENVLFKTDHKLGRNFRASFIRHILKGLSWIHSSNINVHGSLFLSNCVVDSYWVVKLTDFGLRSLINSKIKSKEIFCFPMFNFEDLPHKYLQVAPEILAEIQKTQLRSIGTQKGDIYQLGMLIYQILLDRIPFSELKEDNNTIMKKILSIEGGSIRPFIPENTGLTLRLISIMQQCWQPKEFARPTLTKIMDAVHREYGNDAKGTLVDQMISMIDEYSANLEQIVEKRTEEIEELKEKTERLLYQIMPKSIALELREGRSVRPSMHPSVSVLFADVCQFTAICEQSIPVQIILMLNLLYSKFDQIVELYSAFKVENVGDAYLIVSGIPEMEDRQHLSEVCQIALHFQKFVVESYLIPHRPEHKLRIKVGIHTGALASGILGSTAPRFCVFGDTVNVASRMGSTSEPGRIQMSETAAFLLKSKFEHRFVIQERGIVNIKGKGPCTTFWLIKEGKDFVSDQK